MTYTKFTVSAQGDRKPSYVKGERSLKSNRTLFSANIPDPVKIKKEEEHPKSRAVPQSAELEYVFSGQEREVVTLPKRTNVSSRLMSGFAVIFLAIVSVLSVYVCGISAPDFVQSALLYSCDYLGDKYSALFFEREIQMTADAKEPGSRKETLFEETSYDSNYDYTEGGFIASTVLSQSESGVSVGEAASPAGAFSEMTDKDGAVIVSKDFSRGSDKVYALNDTSLALDTETFASAQYPIEAYTGGDGPLVLIVHTHGTECYADSTADGGVRSTDTSVNVVRVGGELSSVLNSYGIPTLHSKTMHDEISYITSYQSSRKEVQELLAAYPSIKYVIDLHRDAIPDDAGARVKPLAQINGESAAQLMLVMGTSAGGGNHPDYKENLTVAAHVQKRLNALYPGLLRPINLRSAVFNQNLSGGYLLLEVGSDANTLSEALAGVRMFARGFAETVLKGE